MIAVIGQSLVTLFLIASVLGRLPMPAVVALLFGYLVCLGFLSPNTTALAIEPFVRHAGTASALLGSMQMGAGALASALVSYFHDGTALPVAILLLASALVSLALQAGHTVFGNRSAPPAIQQEKKSHGSVVKR